MMWTLSWITVTLTVSYRAPTQRTQVRVTVNDTAANKIPARLDSIKSGALHRSYLLARTTKSSDIVWNDISIFLTIQQKIFIHII